MKKHGTRQPFQVMSKPRGSICNLDCHYCFYLRKEALYPHSSFRMADDLLEQFVRQTIEAHAALPEVTFAWQGGEPTLMGLEFFQRVVTLQRHYRRPGQRILNALQTNGVLLDNAWGRFLHENSFLVGVSLDGPAALHDVYRRDKGGDPTFDRVVAGIDILKTHQAPFNILTCVNDVNVEHPLAVYRFLRDEIETEFIQFIPIVEPAPALVSTRSVSGDAYGAFLIAIFDEWVHRDVG
ncbi:MAG: radical SAM protein, partial [Caldilinea sp.]